MKKASIIAIMAVLAMVMSCFTGCGQAQADGGEKEEEPMQEIEQQPEAPEKREDLIVVMESEPPTLHPFDHASVTAGYMNALTFDQLFDIDIDTLKPVPDLCESYEQLNEATWSFKIYENVYFHDGSHMTAEDVKASMEWAREYPTTADYTSFWTGIEVTDEYTITVTTDGPYAMTLYNLASIKVVPKALIDSGHDFSEQPIGSGPYVFKNYSLGDKIEFEAFEDYFNQGHKPSIKSLTWRIIPEGASRTIALEAGEADLIIEVESNDVERMEENQDIKVYRTSGTRLNFMCMNSERYPFDNKDFRKAFNAAVDRDAVITVACNGQGTKAVSQTPMVFEGASETNSQDYDVEAAKAYLKASGVDTESLVITCIVSNDTARRTAEVIQAYLSEIGVHMEIEGMDYAAQLSAIMGGEYETSIIGYTSNNMCKYMTGCYHSSAIDAANLARINEPQLDALIELARTQTDAAQRRQTLTQASEFLNEWAPYVPLYQTEVIRASNVKLNGFTVSASGAMHLEDAYWAD